MLSKFFIKSFLLRPGSITFKKDTVILPGYFIIPYFGQTLPEFNATGRQGIFKVSYILPTPFLKPIKPGLNRDDFMKKLEQIIYDEIKNIS